jgi:hypothetical protein
MTLARLEAPFPQRLEIHRAERRFDRAEVPKEFFFVTYEAGM